MIDLKQNFDGGLDLDTSLYMLKINSYSDALNITRNAIEGNNDRVISNIVGNQAVSYSLPVGRNICIGSYPFQLRNTVIYFIYNNNGYNSVLEFNATTRTITKIFESRTDSGGIDILNFTEDDKITSIDVYPRDEGDLLFFIDSLGRPTEMDITLFKAGAYTPVTRELIDKAKIPPPAPPAVVYGNDTTRRANNLRNKFFKFQYRWIYDDNEKSSYSPVSIMPIPASLLSDVFTNVITNNNVILMTLNSGGKNVKSVEITMSYVEKTNNWSLYQSVEVVKKDTLGVADGVDFPYSFYNDSTYPFVDDLEAGALFYYTPYKAGAQAMPNGNVLAYAAITEGYNKDTVEDATITVNTVAAGSGGSVGSLDGVLTNDANPLGFRVMDYTFSGIPAVGTLVSIKVRRRSDGFEFNATTYTTVSGDTADTVSLQLIANTSAPSITASHPNAYIIRLTISTTTYETLPSNGLYSELTITPPATSAVTNTIASWLWGTEINIARQYMDQKGRTIGVLYTDKVTFPAYAENGSHQPLIPFINYKINDIPPDYAYSYTFLLTPLAMQWIFWYSINMNKAETEYIYFDVTDFKTNASKKPTTATVLSYSFQDGDRLRLIRRMSDNFVFADTFDAAIEGDVQDPKINGVAQTGRFIKIKNVEPFTSGIGSATNYVIQLYRPIQQAGNKENLVYNEFGREYPILDPTLSTRRHGGQVTDQVVGVTPAEFNFYEGNAYFRGRTIATSDTGYATFNVMDANVVDFYTSAVNSISGRPSEIDINAKQQYYSTLIRFSGAYQANTNTNGLNNFFGLNFDEYDYNYGDVIRLKVRDRYLKVLQKFKIGVVPIFNQISKDSTGKTLLVVTDKLLNPIQYRIGNFGLTYPESLASYHYADYGCDINKGIIWRDSEDGVQAISELYKVDSWAVIELPLRTGASKIYGTFDPKLNQYIIALEGSPKVDGGLGRFSYIICAGGTVIDGSVTFGNHVDFCGKEGTVSASENCTLELISDYDCGGGTCKRYRVTNVGVSDSPAQTLTFSEETNTFESYLSYHPEMMCDLGNLLITFKNGVLYTHDNPLYNTFFGIAYDSSITLVFNKDAAIRRKYLSIGYQSDAVWTSPNVGDVETSMISPQTNLPQISKFFDFVLEENIRTSEFLMDANSMADAREALVNGAFLGGNWIKVKLVYSGNTFSFITLPYVISEVSNRNF